MLSINHIIRNKQEVIDALKIKNFNAEELIDKAIAKDTERKNNQQELDNVLAELNQLSKAIGQLFKSGKVEEANTAKSRTADLKENSKDLSKEVFLSKK